jgi:ankyrin repeat protein
VFRGCERCVRSLLQAGADVNQQDSSGKTALMASVELGHMCLTQLLLSSGADVNKPNSRGETALHVAASGGKVDAVRLLLRHGSNPNATAAGGRTPLSSTVNRRSSPAALEILALLIRANANVELKGRHIYVGDGRALTPFEVAVRGGNLDAARLLAMAGCNIKAARAWLVGINTPRALLQDADMVDLLKMLTSSPLPLMVQCRQVVRKSVHNIYNLSQLRLPVPMLNYLEIPELDTVLEKTRVVQENAQ